MRSLAALMVFFAFATFAQAQVGEFSLSGGVSRFGNANLGTSTDASGNTVNNTIDNGFRLTFRFTLNTYRFAGHEFGYAYNRSGVKLGPSSSVSMSIQQGFYDFLLYATPEGSRIRPFVAGGVEFSSFFPPGASVYYGNQETKFGINYGAGLKMRVTSIIGLRVDFREYNTGKPFKFTNESGRLNQLEASVGASFLF
jgi:opacity protein-like surface antigen